MMKVQISDPWRILLAGALIVLVTSFVAAQFMQWKFDEHMIYVERQHNKQIAMLKSQHTKEVNALKRDNAKWEAMEKKIDQLAETKGKP